MFKYPIFLPSGTLYTHLGLTPEARTDDIRDAKNELIGNLNTIIKSLEKRIGIVQGKIPELSVKRESLKQMFKIDFQNRVRDPEYQKLVQAIDLLEKEALKIDPEFNELEKRLKDANRKISELNISKLENEEFRKKYDGGSTSCAVLKLEDFQPEILTDSRVKLFFIRKSFSDYFEKELSVECYHPSDFTRSDFYHDYEQNSIIDEENNK